MMIDRKRVQEEARKLVGVAFKHQGRSPVSGVDCAGLVACVYRALGVPFEDYTEYGRKPRPEILLAQAARDMDEIDATEARGGDVLLIAFTKPGRPLTPQHFALKTDEGTIIHAHRKAGRVIEEPLTPYWQQRVCGSYRLRGGPA